MKRTFPEFVRSDSRRRPIRRREVGPSGPPVRRNGGNGRNGKNGRNGRNGGDGRDGRNGGGGRDGDSYAIQASVPDDSHALCHQFSETQTAILERLRLEKQHYEDVVRRRHDEAEAIRELQYALELIEAMGTGTVAFGSDAMRIALQMSTELLLGINPDTYQSLREALHQLGTTWEHMMQRLVRSMDAHRSAAAPPM